jgi:hypothetical protein
LEELSGTYSELESLSVGRLSGQLTVQLEAPHFNGAIPTGGAMTQEIPSFQDRLEQAGRNQTEVEKLDRIQTRVKKLKVGILTKLSILSSQIDEPEIGFIRVHLKGAEKLITIIDRLLRDEAKADPEDADFKYIPVMNPTLVRRFMGADLVPGTDGVYIEAANTIESALLSRLKIEQMQKDLQSSEFGPAQKLVELMEKGAINTSMLVKNYDLRIREVAGLQQKLAMEQAKYDIDPKKKTRDEMAWHVGFCEEMLVDADSDHAIAALQIAERLNDRGAVRTYDSAKLTELKTHAKSDLVTRWESCRTRFKAKGITTNLEGQLIAQINTQAQNLSREEGPLTEAVADAMLGDLVTALQETR